MGDDKLEVTARDGKRRHFAWSDDHRAWLLPPGYDDAITALCDALLDARRADDTRAVALEALELLERCSSGLPVTTAARSLLASDRVRRLRGQA